MPGQRSLLVALLVLALGSPLRAQEIDAGATVESLDMDYFAVGLSFSAMLR